VNAKHHAIDPRRALDLGARRIHQHVHGRAGVGAQREIDLLGTTVQLDQREEVRLVKDPRWHGQNLLE
jgi:hypothetical protein